MDLYLHKVKRITFEEPYDLYECGNKTQIIHMNIDCEDEKIRLMLFAENKEALIPEVIINE